MSEEIDSCGNLLFPVFFRLDKLQLLIVGGGAVGLEKVEAIFKNSDNANVTLVAPEIRVEIKTLAQKYPNLRLVYKSYDDKDLEGKDLIIVATNIAALNSRVYHEAKARKIICNVADTPDNCDFYMCSVVKKGDLKIGISTNGKSPTFAKRMREMLEEVLPDGIHNILDNLTKIREKLKGDFEYKVKKMDEITAAMKNDDPKL
ncbi:MAG TPA: bifunctional precorrin-2 dehydrogenase/sirohydrochlorin ferrochelatase [Cytophagaceae bacterium]|jgi:precorrin-2 dehydrogenase/sirohydrochlorin ferrochelatase|nr:bifunctional precorrin-2 dehydrogenase/sirohydrochlorin ferrochelatase [Cytophagaceae bacterium]